MVFLLLHFFLYLRHIVYLEPGDVTIGVVEHLRRDYLVRLLVVHFSHIDEVIPNHFVVDLLWFLRFWLLIIYLESLLLLVGRRAVLVATQIGDVLETA